MRDQLVLGELPGEPVRLGIAGAIHHPSQSLAVELEQLGYEIRGELPRLRIRQGFDLVEQPLDGGDSL